VAQHHPVPDRSRPLHRARSHRHGPVRQAELAYRFIDHARYVDSFLRALDLDRITFVLHDWGSALGFDWALSHEGKVRGLAFMEAILGPMPSWDGFRPEGRETFQHCAPPASARGWCWRRTSSSSGYSRRVCCAHSPTRRWRTTGRLLPTPRRAGRCWRGRARSPSPVSPPTWSPSSEHYREALTRSTLPKLLFTAEPGILVTAPVVAWAREHLPNLEIVSIGPGLHFVQEDHPHEIGAQLAAWVRRLKSPAGAAGPASAAATTKGENHS